MFSYFSRVFELLRCCLTKAVNGKRGIGILFMSTTIFCRCAVVIFAELSLGYVNERHFRQSYFIIVHRVRILPILDSCAHR